MPKPVLGPRVIAVNQTDKNPCPQGAYSRVVAFNLPCTLHIVPYIMVVPVLCLVTLSSSSLLQCCFQEQRVAPYSPLGPSTVFSATH